MIKENHPQVYLEKCEYRIKKMKIPKFIKNKLKSDSDSDSDLDLDLEKIETKIDEELEFISDNDSRYDTVHWFFYLHEWL